VAITFLGEYYAGRGIIIRVTSTDPLLVLVSVIEVSDAIEIPIPFPVDDVRLISQCEGKDIIWEARYLVPFAEVDDADGIGCRPTPCTQGHWPHRLLFLFAVLTGTYAWGSESYWSARHRVRGRVSEFLITTT
jgi:hypothetical protein